MGDVSLYLPVWRTIDGVMTLGITPLNIRGFYVTLNVSDTQHDNTVIMLNVVVLSVVAPKRHLGDNSIGNDIICKFCKLV